MNARKFITVAAFMLAIAAVPSAAVAQKEELVAGQVVKVDETTGKITIKHGPIKKLDMDAGMTMVYRVENPALLKTVKSGDAIRFIPERIDGKLVVTEIEKSQ
jgi:Cu(I)/Ag(I) efflux system protein CusF